MPLEDRDKAGEHLDLNSLQTIVDKPSTSIRCVAWPPLYDCLFGSRSAAKLQKDNLIT
jgi:hypothetical protein